MERDSQRVPKRRRRSNFNSHAHVERDDFATGWIKAYCISTHTLTWSVTQLFWLQWFCHTISTHTLTWSVTRLIMYRLRVLSFQLTRSRGAWLSLLLTFISFNDFNSHAHVERDLILSIISLMQVLFQLTRSRGAWLIDFKLYNISLVFQLTRSRGAWPQSKMIWADVWAFQLTRSRGAWRNAKKFE